MMRPCWRCTAQLWVVSQSQHWIAPCASARGRPTSKNLIEWWCGLHHYWGVAYSSAITRLRASPPPIPWPKELWTSPATFCRNGTHIVKTVACRSWSLPRSGVCGSYSQICDILISLSLICIIIKSFEASTFHTFLCLAFLQFAAIGLYSDELFEIVVAQQEWCYNYIVPRIYCVW